MVQKRLSEAVEKRLRAARMMQAGKGCAAVALAAGVARQTGYTWKRPLDEGAIDALRAVPEPGRPARLDAAQLAALREVVLQSPTGHGFGTGLWTLKRVGAVNERMPGVRFGQTQVWRILGNLGFGLQKPDTRAIERDADAVRPWRRRMGPVLKISPVRRPHGHLHRRFRYQRTPNAGAHMGAQATHACHSVSLQLEACLVHRRLLDAGYSSVMS